MKTFSLSIYFLFLYIIVVSSGSSEGIFQNYEYSLKATKKGGTVIGAHNANYSVIISYPPAAEDDTSQVIKIKPPIAILSPMVGLSYVGITADCAYLKNKMFEEISNSQYVFGSPLIGKRLASNIAARIHRQTLEIHLRPFGVKLCIACIDEIAGPQVFEVDGLGSMHSCRITCLGIFDFTLRIRKFVYITNFHFCI